MGQPSGEIVARPMVARACGCMCEFQHYTVDKYRAQRLAKFQKTRCPDCVAKLVEQQRLAATLPKKAEAFKSLPAGTTLTLTRLADGTWSGVLVSGEARAEATAPGPQALTVTLARMWSGANTPKAATAGTATPLPPKPVKAAPPK